MAKKQTAPSMKRYGSRYGKPLKEKYGATEKLASQEYKCPRCSRQKVKRVSAGIWLCRKCGLKFAGKAYTVAKKIVIKEQVLGVEKEAPIEEVKEEEQAVKEEEPKGEEPEQEEEKPEKDDNEEEVKKE